MDGILPVMWICELRRDGDTVLMAAGQISIPETLSSVRLPTRPLMTSAGSSSLSGTCPPIHNYFTAASCEPLKVSLASKLKQEKKE